MIDRIRLLLCLGLGIFLFVSALVIDNSAVVTKVAKAADTKKTAGEVVVAPTAAVTTARKENAKQQAAGKPVRHTVHKPVVNKQDHPINRWVKIAPTDKTPPSPALGYEGSIGYDPAANRILSYAGHNQGGGGEQNAEMWVLDPDTLRWELKEPNNRPPGACCNAQNVFDPVAGRFFRFRAFSGNHGWHWFRQNYLTNSSVWSYSLKENDWRNLRPMPEPRIRPLRSAAYDSEYQVIVVCCGEGASEGTVVYDPYTNEWSWMNPAQEPPKRSGGQMAYDQARRVHVLFGSQFEDNPGTWVYSLKKNEWTDKKPALTPPSDKNSAVLEYDRANKIVLAQLKITEQAAAGSEASTRAETWAYDVGKNEWKKMSPSKEADTPRNRNRKLLYLPAKNLFYLENYCRPQDAQNSRREQQIWTYRYAEAKPADELAAAENLRVTTTSSAAILTWDRNLKQKISAYAIFRGEGERPWLANMKKIGTVPADKSQQTKVSFEDSNLQSGTVYYYAVQSIDSGGKQIASSTKVRTQPAFIPRLTVSVLGPEKVHLSWPEAEQKDIAGYYLERAVVEVLSTDQVRRLKKDTPPLAKPGVGMIDKFGRFERITGNVLKTATFTDTGIDLRKPQQSRGKPLYALSSRDRYIDPAGRPYRFAVYAYRVRSVNALGVESGPSPYVLTIPSAPEFVFSQEEGKQCQLKWQANREQEIAGYRVYRMDGPKINGPGQKVHRLTAEPISGNRYTDERAGEGSSTKRYWILAVDALGQEGIPSAPAWYNRQWKKFYQPFTGKWHQ